MRGGPHRHSVFTDWLTFTYILVWGKTLEKKNVVFLLFLSSASRHQSAPFIYSQSDCAPGARPPFFKPLGGTVYHIELLYRMMHVCLPAPRIFFIWRRRRRRRPTSRSSRVSIRQLTFNDSKKKKTKNIFSLFYYYFFLDCELFSIYLSK